MSAGGSTPPSAGSWEAILTRRADSLEKKKREEMFHVKQKGSNMEIVDIVLFVIVGVVVVVGGVMFLKYFK